MHVHIYCSKRSQLVQVLIMPDIHHVTTNNNEMPVLSRGQISVGATVTPLEPEYLATE